ncbi:MAG: zinc ABC transporter substrate-binding protein [Clostridia bacterium]
MNLFKKIITGMMAAAIALSMVACSAQEENQSADEKLQIAVSIVPQETFVKAVAGDLVDVVTMIPSGASASNYEPTMEEMAAFEDSAVYFSIGVPTEEVNIMPNVGDVPVVSMVEKVEAVYEQVTFENGSRDPHMWLSPKRVIVMIEAICEELSELDPDNADTYKENADSYCEELTELDNTITEALSDVENRAFIVYHPAFGYLADDYGLTMYSLEEDGKEATAEHLEEMIDFAKENDIKVIFYQAEIDSSQSQTFADEIGGETTMLEPLSPDYIDNLINMAEVMAEAME